MGGQGSGVFSTGTYGSVTSYNNVGEGGFTLPGRVFFYFLYIVLGEALFSVCVLGGGGCKVNFVLTIVVHFLVLWLQLL
jgi:hypothetical protein